MPVFNATTKSAESVWKSPDGQREIFSVKLDVGGKEFEAKTYSRDISQAGFTGEVESYEKPGQNGKPAQTFVKQAQKEFKVVGPNHTLDRRKTSLRCTCLTLKT